MSRDGAQVRARRGTKSTQGINGEAALLGRFNGAVSNIPLIGTAQPCPYDHHRTSDWRLSAGGPTVCGICHPPAAGLDMVSAAETSTEVAA